MQSFDLIAAFPVYRHAMVTGVAIAVCCSLLSVIVVLKRMAFVGQGISHAGLGGLGLAVFAGVLAGPLQSLIVLAFCVATGGVIGWLSRKRHVEADSAIGILLVATMAIGVLLTDIAVWLREEQVRWYLDWVGPLQRQPVSFESLLFGSLLGVTFGDMVVAIVVSLAIVVLFVALLKEIIFYAFDETTAKVFGVPTGAVHYLMLAMLSVAIVVSIRLAGVVLVSALLVIPGATATLLSRRLLPVLGWSLAVGLLGVVGGLVLSLEVGVLSSGACIVAVLCACFIAALALPRQ
jgi:ABC-type Mn2+/Zn2+ transport system permease subunit